MTEIQLFDIGGSFRDGVERGRKRSTLRDFFAPAAGGDRNALARLMQVDPTAAQNAQALAKGTQESAYDRIGKLAGVYAQTQDPAVWRELRKGLDEARFPAEMPWEIATDEDRAGSLKFATSIAQQFGGATQQQELRPHVVGNALVDATGKVLYQGESPEKWSLVNVPDGQGGTVQMEYSNGQWRQPTYGGVPQASAGSTGGASTVMDNAFVDEIGALVSPFGGRITSTVGGQHNAGSKHYTGDAIDIGMAQETPEQQSQIIAALEGKGYRVRDERTRPQGQSVWSGPHLHVERGGQGGPRLGYTPPKGKEPSRRMTPQEVADVGLPTGTVAYMGEDGLPKVVHKPDARTGAGEGQPKLSAGEAAKVRRDFKETKDALNMFRAFDKALSDLPNGVGLLTDGAAKGRLGTAYNNARSSLRILYNTGVLQPGELPMLENALRDPTSFTAVMDPRTRPQIKAQLGELYRVIDRNIQNQVYSYPQIFNQQRFEQVRGAKVGGNAPQAAKPSGDIDSLLELYK